MVEDTTLAGTLADLGFIGRLQAGVSSERTSSADALLRGSGTWARRSRRYWLHAAAVMGEDGIDGRASLGADDGERENFHGSARTPPATRGHAGHITPNHDSAVTPSLHDFAGSLGWIGAASGEALDDTGCRAESCYN